MTDTVWPEGVAFITATLAHAHGEGQGMHAAYAADVTPEALEPFMAHFTERLTTAEPTLQDAAGALTNAERVAYCATALFLKVASGDLTERTQVATLVMPTDRPRFNGERWVVTGETWQQGPDGWEPVTGGEVEVWITMATNAEAVVPDDLSSLGGE